MDEPSVDATAPRAFVVMPFGSKDVPISPDQPAGSRTVDFDELYRLLIAPALRRANLVPFRADEEPAPGDIRTDMFFELVTGDVVVADISLLNANVFYELGIRHGVAERGVVMIHAGWTRRPFDVAPDRTFRYDGSLFEPETERDDAFAGRLHEEVERLGTAFRNALAVGEQSLGSPVYAALRGMRPPDWSAIDTARAKYFQGVLDDWRGRVRIARRNGYPGDILTLARDAPSRPHRTKLLLEAARALSDLQRFDVARSVLEDVLEVDAGNFEAQCRLGLALGRLGRVAEAEELMSDALRRRPSDPEAEGVVGRIHKDAWRASWQALPELDERRRSARATAARARLAIRSYGRAHSRFRDSYYTGINVVGLSRLLEDLGATSFDGDLSAELDDVAVVVRVAARDAVERARAMGREEEVVWPAATLGELALVQGDTARAVAHYEEAVAAPGVTLFQLESMLSQLGLYEELGFRADEVAAVREALEPARAHVVPPAVSYEKVVVNSGHMIDTPDRQVPRFPASAEDAVAGRIRAKLEEWKIGPGDLAICGGARGADILFGEACVERGAHLRLFLPLPESEFRRRSVRLSGDGGRWEAGFDRLLARAEVARQDERLGEPPPGTGPFGRNNLWMLDTARVEAPNGMFSTILVWDGQPAGDGPGGTSDFARRAERLSGRLETIDPTEP
jgi:tetratricopeptide (TPR) repeat protein